MRDDISQYMTFFAIRVMSKKKTVEPMYREIPSHMDVSNTMDEVHKKQLADLAEYRASHPMPWYLK